MRDYMDELTSIEAAKEFKRDCIGDNERKTLANVKVFDDDGDMLFEFEDLEVHVIPNTNYYSVAVMWESQLSTYKKFGLYGLYRTDYNDMEYFDRELTIISDNRRIVIQG
jgi:hypothetical protein